MNARLPNRRLAARREGGFSLIESMVTMAVISVGMLGLLASHVAASRADSQGLKISQATAIAQAMGHTLRAVPWGHATIKGDTLSCNDADVEDRAKAFNSAATSISCKADAGLTLTGGANLGSFANETFTSGSWTGLDAFAPADNLDYNGDGKPDFQVYWNVANCIVNSTTSDWSFQCAQSHTQATLKQIGVIVRWQAQDGTWFKVTMQTYRFNPQLLGT